MTKIIINKNTDIEGIIAELKKELGKLAPYPAKAANSGNIVPLSLYRLGKRHSVSTVFQAKAQNAVYQRALSTYFAGLSRRQQIESLIAAYQYKLYAVTRSGHVCEAA